MTLYYNLLYIVNAYEADIAYDMFTRYKNGEKTKEIILCLSISLLRNGLEQKVQRKELNLKQQKLCWKYVMIAGYR